MTCAIELRCHTRYMAYGPIAFGVRMEADAATHQAVNGLLDRALEVVLVRRDAPGVRFLTKTDPGGLFLPDPVAPPPLPGMSATARVIEEREFDLLDHGRRHDGAVRGRGRGAGGGSAELHGDDAGRRRVRRRRM